MDYDLLGRIMEIIHLDEFYSERTAWENRNAVYYALKHDKVLTHWDGVTLVGYCTYGFFTEEEVELDKWDGDVAYSRKSGGVLFFPKFQCRAGRREVIRFIRGIQDFMFKHYPDVEIGKGLRVYPNGDTRNEKWHRKVA